VSPGRQDTPGLMAKSSHMSASRSPIPTQGSGRRWRRLDLALLGMLILCGVLCSSAPARRASRPRDLAALETTAEWVRVARLWQDLMDQAELAERLEAAEADLEALTKRTAARRALLSHELAAEIRALLRERFRYLRERSTPTPGGVRLNELEAAVESSQWVVEMQLSVLRKAGPWGARPDEKLAEAARGNLEYELTFLHHHRVFQAGLLGRLAEISKQEQEGKTVDRTAFEAECERKRRALVDAYRKRKLPRVRVVRAVIPYVLALTQRPAPQVPAALSPNPEHE